jgi:hypothetical protein
MMKWSDNCGSGGGSITLGLVLVYTNYASSTLTPAGQRACAATRQGSLNHFEIQVSRQHLDTYGSNYSTDNGQSFSNFQKMYSTDLNLAFTRGYVHVSARNHASIKHGFGPDGVYHCPAQRRHMAQPLPDAGGGSGEQYGRLGREHRAASRRACR